MEPLVIYHANCADGFGAAFAAWLKFGDEAEYVPFKYNEEDKLRELFKLGDTKRDIYILDFSFPRELMDWLFSVAKRVVWLDHHASVFKDWGLDSSKLQTEVELQIIQAAHTVTLDNNKSGAFLAWEYFHPGTEVPMLIKHIDDYDRWQFKLEGTKEFNKALWSYAPWSFGMWAGWLEMFEGLMGSINLVQFKASGAAILRAHDANVQAVVKGASRECNFHILLPYPEISVTSCYLDKVHSNWALSDCRKYIIWQLTGLAANCPPHLSSDVGHQLATQSGTYGLLWSINREGKCLCSLRSNGDYDVSAIAKAFGGGGHKNAAGFEVQVETLLEWIK